MTVVVEALLWPLAAEAKASSSTATRSSSSSPSQQEQSEATPRRSRPGVRSPGWLSGASGDGAADGRFGSWRGSRLEIAGTWNDNIESHEGQWSLRDGFSYGSWSGDLDNAVGGIYKDRGETWARAATGAYDARWRRMLVNLRKNWVGRPGTLYIRFAHEFNGNWYGWSVSSSETRVFKAAWRRFRSLQQKVFPASQLVFCPSSQTSPSLRLDWREAFPGRDQIDVVGVDYYNQWPFIRTAADFASVGNRVDATGAPRGLERYRRFAARVGRPLALPEWSSNANMGDSPVFVSSLHSWLVQHAGSGPGQVLYEIEFNASGYGNRYRLYAGTRQPLAAAAYRHLW